MREAGVQRPCRSWYNSSELNTTVSRVVARGARWYARDAHEACVAHMPSPRFFLFSLPVVLGSRADLSLSSLLPDLEDVLVDLIDPVGVDPSGRIESAGSPVEIHLTVTGLVLLHQLADVLDELHVKGILHVHLAKATSPEASRSRLATEGPFENTC